MTTTTKTTTPSVFELLSKVKGIGPATIAKLQTAELDSVETIMSVGLQGLAAIAISDKTAKLVIDALPEALGALETWLHDDDPLPPLVRAGLAHVQFETIHPFLDGNGRIGRLLIVVLLEHWAMQDAPLLYLSVPFKRHRPDYYRFLNAVRTEGDWEGWTAFFLRCVCEAADDAVAAARRLHSLVGKHRRALTRHAQATLSAVRLFEALPEHPMVTLPSAARLVDTSSPTAGKAIDLLCRIGILREVTGRQRDRVYAYQSYLDVLAEDTSIHNA